MSKKSYIIGRAGDITLYDDTVSRKHARLDVDGSDFYLEDLESRNGTFELRNKQLVPFRKGAVTLDQVFAFGECVRSMTQLVHSITDGSAVPAEGAAVADAFDATMAGLPAAPRLTSADIIGLLERAEDRLAGGETLVDACEALGISEQRYQRWCRDHGATRAERQSNLQALRRENERLRKVVADLSLERDALREALDLARSRGRGENTPPNLSVVIGGEGKGKV